MRFYLPLPGHRPQDRPLTRHDAIGHFTDTGLDGSLPPADSAATGNYLPTANLFDACHVGVVLRVVLLVQGVVGVGVMFDTDAPLDWLLRFSLLTGGVLPATLVWLIAVCACKHWLHRLGLARQWVASIAMGAIAGLYGCGMMVLMGLLQRAPWWASAAAGMLLSALVLAGLFWRAKARTPAATAARLAELQSRIRPHFLFNTLNSAIALVRAEPARAEAVLEDLSELFRSALADPAESSTLGQEISLARRYLAIEQVRFGDRLRVDWRLDDSAASARLPPLLLQPLVENAVRHGVEPSATGAQLRISTLRQGGVVIIKVTNSAPAGPGLPGHGLALANVRERLHLLHDVQAGFHTAFKNDLFQVRLEIPA